MRRIVAEQTDDKMTSPWNADGARSWSKWFHVMEAAAGPLSQHMIDLASVAPGQRVLDIATGVGEPAAAAARRVGPGGSVLAIDLSADMLAHGRQRAEDLGFANITFQEMDAQALEVPEDSFDAVLCRWGLMFVADLEAALAGIRRCLKPGGRFVTSIWGPAGGAPGVGLGARVVRNHLRMPPPHEGANSPFAFSDVAAFESEVKAANFAEVHGEWFNVRFAFESAEQFTQFRRDRSGPLRTAIADFPAEDQEAAWRALTEAARDFEAPDGTIQMDNAAFCVAARR